MPGGDNTGNGSALPKSTSAERMRKMREKLKSTDSNYQKEENKRISELKKRKKNQMTEREKEALKNMNETGKGYSELKERNSSF